MEEKLYPRLLEVMRTLFDNLPADELITIDDSFSEDLGLESLDFIDLLMCCETTFGVNIETATAKEIRTIRDLIKRVIAEKPDICDYL